MHFFSGSLLKVIITYYKYSSSDFSTDTHQKYRHLREDIDFLDIRPTYYVTDQSIPGGDDDHFDRLLKDAVVSNTTNQQKMETDRSTTAVYFVQLSFSTKVRSFFLMHASIYVISYT